MINLFKKLSKMLKSKNNTSILADGWIPIEQLPTCTMTVRWLCEDGVEDIGIYCNIQKDFITMDLRSKNMITHYKPLGQ